MARWISIALGVVALIALLVYARILSGPDDDPGTGETAAPIPAAAPDDYMRDPGGTAANAPGISGPGDAANLTAVGNTVGMPARGDATTDAEDARPERYDMPSLEELRKSAESAGPGPSQVNLGLPGPAMDMRGGEVAGETPQQPTTTDAPDDDTSIGTDVTAAGPSQLDLGYSGPGEDVRDFDAASEPELDKDPRGEQAPRTEE